MASSACDLRGLPVPKVPDTAGTFGTESPRFLLFRGRAACFTAEKQIGTVA